MLNVPLPDRGALFVISGPSGVGKSTLVNAAMADIPGLEFSVSATTRSPRTGEVDGKHYHFVSPDRFAVLVEERAFLEHATVYDRSYGTLRSPVEAAIAAGRSVVLDIDVQGARQVRASCECVSLFVLPPDVRVLEERLARRGTDSAEVRARRMAQVAEQLAGVVEFDYVVINDDLEAARATFEGILLAELARIARRRRAVDQVLAQLAPQR